MNRATNTVNLAAAIDGFHGAASVRVRPLTRRPLRAGEIEVRVAASSVNPIDVRRAGGYGRSLFRLMKAAPLLPLLERPGFDATLNFANRGDDATLLRLLGRGALGHATTVHPLLDTLDSCGLAPGAIAALRIKRRQRALAPNGARYAWTVFRPDTAALHRLAQHAAALSALLPDVEEYTLSGATQAYRHVAQRQPGRAILLPAHA